MSGEEVAKERLAAEAIAAELAKQIGSFVVHVATGRLGKLEAIYVKGCWCLDDSKYFEEATPERLALYGVQVVDGVPMKGEASANLRHLPSPVAVLDTGDAFWLGPDAFAVLPESTKELVEKIQTGLRQLVAGVAIVSTALGIPSRVALVVLQSQLRSQLRALEVPAAPT